MIFPAQEVDWNASTKSYSMTDCHARGEDFEVTDYEGKALVLLPSNVPFLENYDNQLSELLRTVSGLGGVTISLQNDDNLGVPINVADHKYVYPFDAMRVRPYNDEINDETSFGPVFVAGSGSSSREDLDKLCVFTHLNSNEIKNRDDLIKAVKGDREAGLYLFEEGGGLINLRKTVQPRIPDKGSVMKFVDETLG